MSRRSRRQQQQVKRDLLGGAPIDVLIRGMVHRAEVRAFALGHVLGLWHSNKRQHGKGSRLAACRRCRRVVIVMPYGSPRLGEQRPVVAGAGVFEECQG